MALVFAMPTQAMLADLLAGFSSKSTSLKCFRLATFRIWDLYYVRFVHLVAHVEIWLIDMSLVGLLHMSHARGFQRKLDVLFSAQAGQNPQVTILCFWKIACHILYWNHLAHFVRCNGNSMRFSIQESSGSSKMSKKQSDWEQHQRRPRRICCSYQGELSWLYPYSVR